MAIIRELNGIMPKIGKNCFIAETAVIIGDVTIGDDCSIWYGAVLRGDVNSIIIGNRVNVQDNACIHTTYKKSISVLGDDVSVGHNAVIHGAKATSGRSMICPASPTSIGRGRFANILKSSMPRVKPRSNIKIVRIGSTIKRLFIGVMFAALLRG